MAPGTSGSSSLGSDVDRVFDLRREDGTGMVGTLGGLAMFAMFLLFAVNMLVHLYTASTVSAVAFDAASSAAGGGAAYGATQAAATANARSLLGGIGDNTVFDWSGSTPDQVSLRVQAPGPHLLPRPIIRRLGLEHITRTVVVRVERFQSEHQSQ